MPVIASSIKFGTDGWRGVIGDEFTFERLALVAPVAAKVLYDTYYSTVGSRTIIVGYDRRFMAEDFARAVADAVTSVGFDVLLSEGYAPTPAFSWAAKQLNALGALVITASHNPGAYLGLKVKGYFGGSVSPEVTKDIEALLSTGVPPAATPGKLETFDPWPSYTQGLEGKVDIAKIRKAIASGELTVFADVMHGAAATGLGRLLGERVQEINSDRDPLFGGGAPEPLPKYLSLLFETIRKHRETNPSSLSVGLVFDGDCDRIAAVDGNANFLSSQILIPILIDHLTQRRNFTGEIVKTVSGSDLIPKVAALHNLAIFETAVGYKYIADRMLAAPVLLGGEESGGIGYGSHIPERDALLSALYVLEAIVESGLDLGDYYRQLQEQTGFSSAYDRIDLPLASMDVRARLLQQLQSQPLTEIAGKAVIDCNTTDGYKFRLADNSWLMIRFSGTEPVLRLYCEASTLEQVHQTLAWAKHWAE
ncbi:Phosphoglucomutase/phosphomannomutase [Trichormus variabilis ATCC 29413]|uniref:Phosphoglucomutase/phosphomannomutase n=2 Tax=Anabaena variabilis TaxID=264691 RepID=Q3MAK1_TRIV2|nr:MULTISPECIES: phosphoglucomutase/phosphomannomutase family protein [Nostocaceae]ABA21985.1 Phosphoglucomutase/phosphomannomutase [Trichormus variabilis ATCC 29413]MBC1216706.1 phosphoglucomutase/phosphomannomutase family protein [Trichormus variabilis ARAD]MBC1256345.1 phosphoglucomutase/phosphomannomutase family protein [Trichormus variabilis V5]MBC1269193.1 phosphoglucomutase/phosphomannomutase family protein [Trichormus variabilis FSR]MBC1304954.1 phosphoglucomutase/phosphomannomutase fa